MQRSALCRSRRELSNVYYLQNLASIQPLTSPFKFARSPRTDPPGRCVQPPYLGVVAERYSFGLMLSSLLGPFSNEIDLKRGSESEAGRGEEAREEFGEEVALASCKIRRHFSFSFYFSVSYLFFYLFFFRLRQQKF